MKKRIFIAIHYLEIGGAEISLIGLLQSIDYSRYDVDLFVYSHRGELMEFIPPQVNLLPEEKAYSKIEAPLSQTIKSGFLSLALRRASARKKFISYSKRHPSCGDYPRHYIIAKEVLPSLPSLYKYGEYDLAISFLQPHNIVLEKVKAKKKICWIHTDYRSVGEVHEEEINVWEKYDAIVSISESVSESFCKAFPSLKSKLVLMRNILPATFVRKRAEEISEEEVEKEMPRKAGVANLLSVGRFSEAKNYENVPDICKKMLSVGTRVCWYIIGYGSDENQVRSAIAQAGMGKHVKLLGKKANPYPYIKACDVYVQPSKYEGNSVTVREAQMLHRPVAITNYATAASQVEKDVDGVIVPLDNEGCARELSAFLADNAKIERITREISHRDYTNQSEIKVLEKLID